MADSFSKKEREKKKQQVKKEKAEKKQERKESGSKGDLASMMVYVDENGNFSSTPPDPSKRVVINVEDIEIGVPKHEPVNPEDLIRKGIVSFFNDAKGYGFIKDSKTQESIFVHANSLTQQVKQNSKVSFEVEAGPKGLNAVNVKIIV